MIIAKELFHELLIFKPVTWTIVFQIWHLFICTQNAEDESVLSCSSLLLIEKSQLYFKIKQGSNIVN